jgi:hypothetical protein
MLEKQEQGVVKEGQFLVWTMGSTSQEQENEPRSNAMNRGRYRGVQAARGKVEEAASVTARQFIEVWQKSSSLAEVAAKVRRKKSACRVRAFRYRQRGVPLKEFPAVEVPETDWEELVNHHY